MKIHKVDNILMFIMRIFRNRSSGFHAVFVYVPVVPIDFAPEAHRRLKKDNRHWSKLKGHFGVASGCFLFLFLFFYCFTESSQLLKQKKLHLVSKKSWERQTNCLVLVCYIDPYSMGKFVSCEKSLAVGFVNLDKLLTNLLIYLRILKSVTVWK